MAINIKSKKSNTNSGVFLLLSVLFHAAFMATAYQLHDWVLKDNKISLTRSKEIEIEVVPQLIVKKEIKTSQQIAESDLVEKSKQAKPDAYLGQQTQIVKRQTRSKEIANFRSQLGKSASKEAQSHNNEKSDVKISNLAIKTDFAPLGHLNPSERQAAASAGSATNDYLKDVVNGSQTLLNTREYAYFSFYRRVRRQLEQFWEPGLKHRIHTMVERGRNLASEKEHATKLVVELNDEGQITKVQVENTSGVVDLDQAAIDAFNQAGPFPNPPRGMIDNKGRVKIEWEFVLKT